MRSEYNKNKEGKSYFELPSRPKNNVKTLDHNKEITTIIYYLM